MKCGWCDNGYIREEPTLPLEEGCQCNATAFDTVHRDPDCPLHGWPGEECGRCQGTGIMSDVEVLVREEAVIPEGEGIPLPEGTELKDVLVNFTEGPTLLPKLKTPYATFNEIIAEEYTPELPQPLNLPLPLLPQEFHLEGIDVLKRRPLWYIKHNYIQATEDQPDDDSE